jgi:methyl coenzyme M reductase subunit D
MKTWKIEITLKVDDSWVADGFDASERIEEIEDLMTNMLPYAYEHEVQAKVKILKAPAKEAILKLQGYE